MIHIGEHIVDHIVDCTVKHSVWFTSNVGTFAIDWPCTNFWKRLLSHRVSSKEIHPVLA